MPRNNFQQTSPAPAEVDDNSKVLAALSYPIWIVAIVSIAMAKDNKYLKYHGFQGLFWGIGVFVLYIGLIIVSTALTVIPFIGLMMWFLTLLLYPLIGIGALVASILFAVKAYQGEKFQIPVIYNITKSIVKDLE